MATKMLESSAVSAFCESVAVMHSAGIQMDEAVFLLGENMEDAAFKRACDDVYKELIVGKPLALAMDDSGCFPSHVVDMVGAGEHAGRLENVLWSLARYYDEEDRLYAKIKNAIAYPAALLCVMSAILLFTVIVILPVFVDVYHGLTGNLTAGSFGYVNASIIIGWIALGVTLLCTVLVVLGVLAGRSAAGRQRLLRLFEKAPLTRGPMRQMAVSRFTAALATFVAAGVDTDTAMEKAVAMVDHGNLKSQLEASSSPSTPACWSWARALAAWKPCWQACLTRSSTTLSCASTVLSTASSPRWPRSSPWAWGLRSSRSCSRSSASWDRSASPMYHELTKQEIRRRTRKRMAGLLAIVLVVMLVWLSSNAIGASLREQGELSVRNAILNSAKQCCAIEGAYPSSLAYLEENYGLVVNRSDYAITYEVFADNVMPNVVVLAK